MSTTHHKQVIKYYEDTDWDHRYVWNRGFYQAAHFGIYDAKARTHKSALLNTNFVMAELSGVQPGEHVLDAGCGWGGSSLWLAKERKAIVTGVNITNYQINECKEKAKKLGLQNQCTFIEADYCDTPFADDQFDVIWSCESLCHTPRKEHFYEESYRMLKPGGRLIIADYQRLERPFEKDQEKLLRKWLDGWACVDIDTPEEHQKHAKDAGFANITQKDYSKKVETSLQNLYTHAARWSWLGTVASFLRLMNPVRNKNVKGTKAMYQTYKAGLWRYSLILCEK